MKLHLPVRLRKAVLTCFSVVSVCTLYSGGIVAAADLTLAEADSLVVDYADSSSITDLSGGTLALAGGTELLLKNCGEGDGKTYTLLTGVSSLLDADGNSLTLTEENKAASLYFDTTQPGTGFWGGGWLQLTSEGHVQLVGHNETVKEAVTITTRRTSGADYQYYAGVTFENIEYAAVDSDAYGGAIYGDVTMTGNGDVSFSGNTASSSDYYSAFGGAICGSNGSTITLSGNGSVVFEGNTASSFDSHVYGGAIYGDTITLSDNGSVTFSWNTAESGSYSAYGGAIFGDVTMTGNGDVSFSGNTASSSDAFAKGGAICGPNGSTITLSDNGSVVFEGNTASSSDYWAEGGAIDGGFGTITLSNNGSVSFSGNTASASSYARGGAIDGDSSSTITLSDNGSVSFIGNTASGSSSATGGAIYGDTITLSNNGSVSFIENTASSSGGAIYTGGSLLIRDNDSVEFAGNMEKSGSTYRLRGVYIRGGSGAALNISAAEGKTVAFYDSMYAGSDTTVNFNADYEDAEGNLIEQKGDILFTGATTVNDLYKAKGNAAGTAEEIRLSRTTEVKAMTNLYGGRLRVEDGAVYQGQGITAHEASEAAVRVKDAELSHAGYNLEFNAGTALEVAGNSTILGNVNLKEGSLFKLEQAASLSLHETVEADAATLTVNGGALLEGGASLNASLTLADGATLDMDALDVGAVTLNGALTFGGQVTMGDKLLGILSEMSGWEESVTLFTGLTDLVLPAVAADDAADRLWVGDVFSNLAGNENYYFNYVPEVGSLAVVHVPEPATTTLGLLALSALAARRRRK